MTAPREHPLPHVGFREDGSSFRIRAQVDNAVTRLAHALLQIIEREMLPPSGAVLEITRRPEFFRLAFAQPTLIAWSRMDRFYMWPQAPAQRSLDEWVRSGGGRYLWLSDPWAWTKLCDAAEQHHGYGSRQVPRRPLNALLEEVGS